MKRPVIAAAAIAAALTSFAAHASGDAGAPVSADANAVKCYLLGCYDGEGNKVDKTITASVASTARDAIGSVQQTKTTKATKTTKGAPFAGLIAAHAKANGVPLDLAKAVVRVESNFRVNARGRAGEVGLMQIKHSTARAMGYGGSTKGLYDPDTNIRYGMKYLGIAHKLGDGSVCSTLLRYNAGHGAKRMNKISAAYCSKVKRHIGT